MVINPKQIGPLTLKDLIGIFKKFSDERITKLDRLENESKKIARNVNKNLDKMLSEGYRELKNRLIKEVFEEGINLNGLKKSEVPYLSNEFTRIFKTLVTLSEKNNSLSPIEISKSHYIEGTSDFYACYLPSCDYNFRYGIYFNVKNCLKTIIQNNLNPEIFIATIAIHELFHAFIEIIIEDDVCRHNHVNDNPPYCRLEEASANYMAYKWIEMIEFNKKIDNNIFDVPPFCRINTILNSSISTNQFVSDIKKIKNILFNTKMKGYGEYNKIDKYSPLFVPYLIKQRKCDPQTDYGPPTNSRLYYKQFLFDKNLFLWINMCENINNGIIPFYFDIYN